MHQGARLCSLRTAATLRRSRCFVSLPAVSLSTTLTASVAIPIMIAIPVAKPLPTLTHTPARAAPATMCADFLHHRLIEDGGRLINYDAVGRGG
jgi:hypothetical protein